MKYINRCIGILISFDVPFVHGCINLMSDIQFKQVANMFLSSLSNLETNFYYVSI